MSKRTIHTLTWSSENNAYELATQAQPSQHFSMGDEHSWLAWLATHTSFLFQGRVGRLRACKESRPRGEDYWYAYSFTNQRLRKRYLGRSSALSFAHLEEVDGMLQGHNAPLAQAAQPQTAASWEDSTALPLALRIRLPDVGEAALALLQSPQSMTLATILTVLLNELASLPMEIVLILDDYHVIEEKALHEALFFFLEHLPAGLHLILSTRVGPDFPLSRWRARGQLIEIRAADLRFTATEASLFLTEVMGLSLSEEQSGIVEQRTEGWIAGLQLTALSLQKQGDPSAFLQHLRGSHRFLLDYVQEEILQHQSLRMQRFLLQTAILTRMNAALRAALLVYQGAFTEGHTLAGQALALLPASEQQWRMVCLTLAGMGEALAGQPIQARQLLLQSQALAEATGSYIGKMANTILLGDGCISRGELQQAARYFRQALTTLDDQPGFTRLQIRLKLGAGEEPYYEQVALYGLAALFYEWNDLQVAQQYLQDALQEQFHPLLLILTPDEGPQMAALLNTLLPDTGEKELTQYVRTLLRAFPEEGKPASRAGSEPSLLIEPLTQRELEVLRLLAEGASNQDIADQLVIALATVKKHVSTILSKLGARNRVDALARAREQRLLDEH